MRSGLTAAPSLRVRVPDDGSSSREQRAHHIGYSGDPVPRGYRLEQLIGQGGMGVVYRAYDRRLKRTVAVKFITPELALDARLP